LGTTNAPSSCPRTRATTRASRRLGLLVGHPARISVLEGAHVHAEDEHVDAVIALAGDGIKRRLRAANLFRLHALVKLGDDTGRQILLRDRGVWHRSSGWTSAIVNAEFSGSCQFVIRAKNWISLEFCATEHGKRNIRLPACAESNGWARLMSIPLATKGVILNSHPLRLAERDG